MAATVGLRVVLLTLALLLSVGCQILAPTASGLADRFAEALQAHGDVSADAYLSPDAEVFLQGAPVALSRAAFHDHLAVLLRSNRGYRLASRVFATPGGAGWLLRISQLSDPPSVTSERAPQLWMEVRVAGGQITRVWIHFTVEALPRLGIQPEAYRRAAEARGIPLPADWLAGTPAMLAAAERADRQSSDANPIAPGLLLLGAVGVASLRLVAWRVRRAARRGVAGEAARGQWLARLGQEHALTARNRPWQPQHLDSGRPAATATHGRW